MIRYTRLACSLFAVLIIAAPASAQPHSADSNLDSAIGFSELLRLVQFYNSPGFQCDAETEDGYAPNMGDQTCAYHTADYAPQDWMISLSELLRQIQIYNAEGYRCDNLTEDGFNAGGDTGSDCISRLGTVAGYLVTEEGTPRFSSEAPATKATTPLPNITLFMPPLASFVNTGPDGYFEFENVPAGFYTIQAALEPVLEHPVTVLRGTTVVLGDYPVSRAEALDTVTSALQLDPGTDTRPWMLVLAHHPLPAGTVIIPALGDADGLDKPNDYLRIATPKWFVFCDLNSTLKWNHEVVYALVDAATGTLETFTRFSWPLLNGIEYYGSDEINLTGADTAYLPLEPAAPEGEGAGVKEYSPAATPMARAAGATKEGACCTDPKTYALLVRGHDDEVTEEDIDDMSNALGEGLLPGELVVSNYDSCGDKPESNFLAKFREVCALTRPCDTLMLYITAHGTRGGAKLEHGAFACGTKALGESADFDTLYPSEIPWEECKACNIVLIVDACFSGVFASAAQQTRFNGMTGKKVAVMTATSASKEAGSFGRLHVLRETGSVFSAHLEDVIDSQVDGVQDWDPWKVDLEGKTGLDRVFDATKKSLEDSFDPWGEFKNQSPQKFIRIPPPEEQCCPPITVCTVLGEFSAAGETCGFGPGFADSFTVTIQENQMTLHQNGTGDTTTGTIDAQGNFSTSRVGASYDGTFDPETCSGEALHLYDTFDNCIAEYQIFFSSTER